MTDNTGGGAMPPDTGAARDGSPRHVDEAPDPEGNLTHPDLRAVPDDQVPAVDPRIAGIPSEGTDAVPSTAADDQ